MQITIPFTVKLIMAAIATWRFWRLIALDTGPKQCFRKFRIWIGVRYNSDYSKWETDDGSLAEGLTCINCSPIWWGMFFGSLLVFAPDWLFAIIATPLVLAAFTLVFEKKVFQK
jgi:hypothetical protein